MSQVAERLEHAAIFLADKNRQAIEDQGADFSNLEAWAHLPEHTDQIGLQASGHVVAVATWYLAVLDGTGAVERDFGSVKQILDAHSGPLENPESLALLAFHLPDDETAIAQASSHDSQPYLQSCD